MVSKKQGASECNSTNLAADRSLIPVWDPSVPFPSYQEMEDVGVITHVAVERAKNGGYHYLHEATVTWHRDRFYMGWANHCTRETGDHDELVRGSTSTDALHWSEPDTWAQAPLLGATSHNCPLLFTHHDRLYIFIVCWREEHRPITEQYILNDLTNEWEHIEGSAIYGFVPFGVPERLSNGNWLVAGENYWYEAAVIISKGDDLTKWRMVEIPRPKELKVLYPETAVVYDGKDHLLAICRPYNGGNTLLIIKDQYMPTAPISESFDNGETWTPLCLSNFPLADSQPFGGRLSNGQNYLLTNHLEEGRGLLTIALTGAEGGLFRRIFKVRHQHYPLRRLFNNALGKPTEWSYPNAFERDGKLYIAYSQGKEDCILSIIPIEALVV
jgi:hypothetical protein